MPSIRWPVLFKGDYAVRIERDVHLSADAPTVNLLAKWPWDAPVTSTDPELPILSIE